jgi:fatty acid desaturase
MYTVFPVLLELAEMTEHHWHANPEDMIETTTSTIPGIFTKLFVSEMNRTLHREHHLISKVPCYKLLSLHRLLAANGLVPPAIRGLGRTILNKPGTVDLAMRRATMQTPRPRSAGTAGA